MNYYHFLALRSLVNIIKYCSYNLIIYRSKNEARKISNEAQERDSYNRA